MLFSEPKIPQNADSLPDALPDAEFQCSSASRKFLKRHRADHAVRRAPVSVLFSEPKIPQTTSVSQTREYPHRVSVLFSEPKIPQSRWSGVSRVVGDRFSALQRAENSSNSRMPCSSGASASTFQCSSASRKFLKLRSGSSSAVGVCEFQCSSASRKFLKCSFHRNAVTKSSVSVLFSEPKIPQILKLTFDNSPSAVSVLFSEPKIPQICLDCATGAHCADVSVLFSEPKIPQTLLVPPRPRPTPEFQCSSASRKFLKVERSGRLRRARSFQCSSASRKFLKIITHSRSTRAPFCFSALQRAENSSNAPGCEERTAGKRFQCSSASRKFLKRRLHCAPRRLRRVSVLFSEPKIPQIIRRPSGRASQLTVSVLFSEPKIPQTLVGYSGYVPFIAFQCSSASRKFLKYRERDRNTCSR